MKGRIFDILELKNNRFRITMDVEGSEGINDISRLKEGQSLCNIEIKRYRVKRSLSANAYCWVLIEKIADKMNKSKEEVYVEMLKDYGTIAVDSEGKKLIFSVKASIDISEYFKYYKEMGLSKDGNFKHYYVIKGSSEYDSKEMNRFIEGIIQECKNLNIETMTPEEIARLEVGNE